MRSLVEFVAAAALALAVFVGGHVLPTLLAWFLP